ncbi:hypothetical protein RhiirA4_408001 [Rhizophagus irregularis]|uniref:Uncharacterized protein n=1 Tax=Rhizophagus irregularis TaxID=588596 RepID=A0A2I1GZK9_9GLOM|nr:hypothetical protein RhiirA4_408001 [Rhizophagus irregularis]
MPEPRNFTEAYYSIQQDLIIPDSKYISGYQSENNDSKVIIGKNVKDESERIYSNNLESNKLFF